MTVIDLARKLLEYDPNAEVEFQFISDGEIRMDIDDVEIDGSTVIIPQNSIMLGYQNIVRYDGFKHADKIIINFRR